MLFFQCMVLLSVTLSASGACPQVDFMCMCMKWENGCFVCPCQGQTAQTNGGSSGQLSAFGGFQPGKIPGQGTSGTQPTVSSSSLQSSSFQQSSSSQQSPGSQQSSGSQQSGSGSMCKPTSAMCRQFTTDAQGCPICVQGGDNSPQSVQNSLKVGTGQNPGSNCPDVDFSCGIHMCLDPVSGCPFCCNGGSNQASTRTTTGAAKTSLSATTTQPTVPSTTMPHSTSKSTLPPSSTLYSTIQSTSPPTTTPW